MKILEMKPVMEALGRNVELLSANAGESYLDNEASLMSLRESVIEAAADFYKREFVSKNSEGNNLSASHLDSIVESLANDAGNMVTNMYSKVNEAAVSVGGTYLASTIATTMRRPMETTIHRLYRTESVKSPFLMFHEIIPKIKAPNKEEIAIFDAFAKGSNFIDDTEIYLTALSQTGVSVGDKNVAMTTGLDSRYRVSRDAYISGVTLKTPIAGTTCRLVKGTSPYFEAKDRTSDVAFEFIDAAGAVKATVDVQVKIDFDGCVIERVTGSSEINKVLIVAKVSHEQHLHPIEVSVKTDEPREYNIPTRPHIEISIPTEIGTDASRADGPLKGLDLSSFLSNQVAITTNHLEEQRLFNTLRRNTAPYEYQFDFEAPNYYSTGNISWFQKEFVPQLEQLAALMMADYQCYDCYFKVGIPNFLLTLLQPDFTISNGSVTGTSVPNFTIGVKTASVVFEFNTSDKWENNMGKMLLVPNKTDNAELRTFHYAKYDSFLTDKLRKATNNALPAITFSERNAEFIFTDASADVKINNLAIDKYSETATTFIRRR